MPVPLNTSVENLERMRRNVALIDDPVAFAHRYLHIRGFTGGRDEEVLLDVAVESIVKAGLSWKPQPDGVSFTTWAYKYMDREVFREIKRDRLRLAEMSNADANPGSWDGDWLRFNNGVDWVHRIELRVDLQRWADLAELSDHHRWVVQYLAYHMGTYVRDTRFAGEDVVSNHNGSYRQALKHMRQAAITGERRDDKWVRARRSQEQLAGFIKQLGDEPVVYRPERGVKVECCECRKKIMRRVFAVNGHGDTWCYTCHLLLTGQVEQAS